MDNTFHEKRDVIVWLEKPPRRWKFYNKPDRGHTRRLLRHEYSCVIVLSFTWLLKHAIQTHEYYYTVWLFIYEQEVDKQHYELWDILLA